MTQAALASEIGISRNKMMMCESGKSDFNTETLKKACEVLGVSVSYLIDPEQERPASERDGAAAPEICFSAKDFSARLRTARVSAGITQYEAASRLGISQPSYARYEQGETIPRADSFLKLAQTVCTSVPYLLGLADDPAQATLTDEESRLVADYRTMRPDLKGVLSKTAAAFARPAEGAGG